MTDHDDHDDEQIVETEHRVGQTTKKARRK